MRYGVDQQTAQHLADRVELVLEGGHNAEVSPAAPYRPEEIGVRGGTGRQQLPVGGDHIHRQEVIAGQAIGAHQVAVAAAQREPRDAGRTGNAARRGQAEGLRLVVEVAPRAAALGAGRAGRPDPRAHSVMRDRSIIRPPSQTAKPGTPWPPPRTATTRLWVRAKVTAAMTSATPAQRTIRAGRRSIMPL